MSGKNGPWPVSATQWIFGTETLETTADRMARLGYEGIELAGEPDQYSPQAVRAVVEPHGLKITSICGIYSPQRDLSHPSSDNRWRAVQYVRSCAELAAALGAGVVIVVPTAVGRIEPAAGRGAEWHRAADSIREAARAAEAVGVRLVIEALNRYETYLVNTLDVAAQLAAAVDHPNVGIMADLFHMNLEEASIADAIRSNRQVIWHVHLADSNRRAPGLGHTDFSEAIKTVSEVGYQGALTMEFLPPTANPYLAASLDVPESQKTADSEQAIKYLRDIVAALRPVVGGQAGVA